jgi:hypothetical protein
MATKGKRNLAKESLAASLRGVRFLNKPTSSQPDPGAGGETGMPTMDDAITLIRRLRERVSQVERAFTAYVTDGLDSTRRGGRPDPPILGLCANCGFPVYDSDVGDGGRFHYSPQGYVSKPIVCDAPRLEETF